MPQSTTEPESEPPGTPALIAGMGSSLITAQTPDGPRSSDEFNKGEKLELKRLLTTAQAGGLIRLLPAAAEEGSAGAGLLHSGWYTTDDVADLIGVDPSTLRRWRTSTPMQGPPFVRLTSRVTMYSVPDVEAWLASRRVVPGAAA